MTDSEIKERIKQLQYFCVSLFDGSSMKDFIEHGMGRVSKFYSIAVQIADFF